MSKHRYDVIVIGGGHAGTEAAAAAARTGADTCLITHKKSTIGEMSCNPAIGGVAKGTLVKEVDALDGIMGQAIDQAGIHFRMLNRSKGPAVWGPRAQADRALYKKAVQALLQSQENLTILEAAVDDIIIENNSVSGIITDKGDSIDASAVVLTTGTFLRGQIHMGDHHYAAGRIGEKPSIALAERLYALNLRMGRLKTGTPPRLHKDSIAWHALEPQPSDTPPIPFSSLTEAITVPQIDCYITHTNAKTHEIIQQDLHLSAIYGGHISSSGPRYCPSIEDKVVRFADRNRHQIFLEPEGLDDPTIYPNGLSTSLPKQTQEAFIRSIHGLENAEILQYGYAIEYDYVDARELTHGLMVRSLPGLFLAGQINGTTGYEEAAGQGIMAGINAAHYVAGKEPFLLDRAHAFIGVMIDDLVRLGTTEPYRMFTSRAEYRLQLRPDNADLRLTPLAATIGVVGKKRLTQFQSKASDLNAAMDKLRSLSVTPNKAREYGIQLNHDGVRRTGLELLSYPDVSRETLLALWPELAPLLSDTIYEQCQIEAIYDRYYERQNIDIAWYRDQQNIHIPEDIDYFSIASLSSELRQKLAHHRPKTLAQAQSISGMTPAALTAIMIHIQQRRQQAA